MRTSRLRTSRYNWQAMGPDETMTTGFVLISAQPGTEHDVYNELIKMSEVMETHPLFGEYDIIAKIEAEDFEAMGQIVANKIRILKGVTAAKVLTGIEF